MGGAALAIHKPSPRIYLVVFFGFLLWSGFSVRVLWPFHPWSLWGVIQPTSAVYYEIEVADAEGNRLRYDYRAAPPILPTQLHQLGPVFMEPAGSPRRAELGRFLLDRANAYRREHLAGGPTRRWWNYPAREFGAAWTHDELAACGPFTLLVISKRSAEIPSAGPGGPAVTVVAESSWP